MKHVRDDADAGCLDEVLRTPWSARAADVQPHLSRRRETTHDRVDWG